jgi:hypothetical protein
MGSPPTDVLMLNAVAAIVHDLVEFSPVLELFQTYLNRWRKKNALIVAQRRKAECQLATLWRDEPNAADPDEHEHWPVRRIYSPDRTKSDLFRIPPELNRKLERYSDPSRHHLLRALDSKQDFSRTESFVLLAELHDATYQSSQIGYTDDYIAGVADATKIMSEGSSQVAVERLATLVERVLDLIESRADANAENGSRVSLEEIIVRSRKNLASQVILSRQHFVTHTNQESLLQEILEWRNAIQASKKAYERPAANQNQVAPDSQGQHQTTSAKAGGKGGSGKASPNKRGRKPAKVDKIVEACRVHVAYKNQKLGQREFCEEWNRNRGTKVGCAEVGLPWLKRQLALVRKLMREEPHRIPKEFANELKPLRRVKRVSQEKD